MGFSRKTFRILIYNLTLLLPALVLMLIVFPTCSIILIPFLLWRKFITKLAPILRPDLHKMVTAEGSVMGGEDLYAEDVLTSVVILEVQNPRLDAQCLKDDIQKNGLNAMCKKTNTLLYPELKQTIKSWMGYLFWAPVKEFNLDDHVSVREYPKGFDIKKDILRITRKKYWIEGKPLWEFIIINNAYLPGKTEPCSMIYFRMHHIIGDGFCILQLLTRILGDEDAPKKVAKPKVLRKSATGIEKLFQKIAFFIKVPFHMVDFCWMQRTRWTMPNRLVVRDTRDLDLMGAMTDDVPLSALKKVKNQLGVDFTSLILALITGSIREMLLKTFGKNTIPENAAIGFPMPLKNRPEKLRNHITYGIINLPVGTSDPLKRLQIISKSMRKMQTSSIPWVTGVIFQVFGCMPQSVIRFIKARSPTPPFVLSNLLGPAELLLVHKSPVLGLQIGSNAPVDAPSGWAFMFISYNGNSRFTTGGLSSQLQTFEEADELAQLCITQLDIISKAGFENENV